MNPAHSPITNPEYSVAGFLPVAGGPRQVYNLGIGWRFHRGPCAGAESPAFDDSGWEVVSVPHSVDGVLPEIASGCANYQGPAWYRKHFTAPATHPGRMILHFEGIMGKATVWLNGKEIARHFSPFLPLILDVTDTLVPGKENLIAVLADNSDDPAYPPGKPQGQLDYSYFGGIYRDVFLLTTGNTFVTDPNTAGVVAGGGIAFRTLSIKDGSASVAVEAHVSQGISLPGPIEVAVKVAEVDGKDLLETKTTDTLQSGTSGTVPFTLQIPNAPLWHPDDPRLVDVTVTLLSGTAVLDAVRLRTGIRTLEMKPGGGFVLNGAPFPEKLMGVNRHQDFAQVGMALPRDIHWRDAVKIRSASQRVVRSAHYPQSPAFMDACDALGLFVIVNTPGWQFWNGDPIFAERVYSDIRHMVRRDRNRPSVLLWEPILNETNYPPDFAEKTHRLVHEEFPWPGCYTAADSEAKGAEHFDVLFGHPPTGNADWAPKHVRADRTYFTREYGDCVDEFGVGHNSPSRVAMGWGEEPMLIQARHYARPTYPYTSYDSIAKAPASFFGGTLWHVFDHQRGYHPDPFYGGIMDGYRQPKTSFRMFKSQRPAHLVHPRLPSGPMVFIAHAMTPFSPDDVTVYSNCEAVRLTVHGQVVATLPVPREKNGMPSPILMFPGAFDFIAMKALYRNRQEPSVGMVAEGLIGGQVVATHKIRPGRRAERISLHVDDEGITPKADGSSFVTVIATVTDREGNPKRLNEGSIAFSVTGAGVLLEAPETGTNPRPVRWGTAPALVRMATEPGTVRVVARYLPGGSHMPLEAEISFESAKAPWPSLHREVPVLGRGSNGAKAAVHGAQDDTAALKRKIAELTLEVGRLQNIEVEVQQRKFERGGAE